VKKKPKAGESPISGVIDPLRLAKLCWPHVSFYKEQREMLYSIRDNRETFVPAGNKLGKDFTTGYAVLWFFLSRSPCKILTTSVDSSQLQKVLWGEINTFIQQSKYSLPLRVIHQEIRRVVNNKIEPNSYIIGRVAQAEEGMLGHHLPWGPNGEPHTLMAGDEASGIGTGLWDKTRTWRHRALAIGNCYPCMNFFYSAIKEGDVASPVGDGFFRKVIKIRADDSPNVRLAEKEIAEGKKPSGKVLVPGVVTYEDYLLARATYDEMNQCISLDAEFYEGDNIYLFPPQNLSMAEGVAKTLGGPRHAKAIGCDPAEGGDSTTWAVVDELGLLNLITEKTPDTSYITGRTIALMNEYGVPADKVMFDRGGGGKQHADRLRSQGYPVHTVAFGEPVLPEKKRGVTLLAQQKLQDEVRYIYKSRRVQMFHILSTAIANGYALPGNLLNQSGLNRKSLAEQLKVFPLMYDPEGRLKLPQKNKTDKKSKEITLVDMIGHSPDEADALAVAYYCMTKQPVVRMVGAV
tara:strand:- start:11457 stop:13013 length:1557 start_codon:yes stop_codon:yes gene_type:complete